jgi:hypothetical protein
MGHAVRIDQRAVTSALQARSQRLFTDVLAQLLGTEPDPAAISDFARRHPDRWAHAVAMFAGLAGFSRDGATDGNVALQISRMSDSELERRLAEAEAQLESSLIRS